MCYRLNGFPKPIANPHNCALAKATLFQQLVAFKGDIKSIVKRTIDDSADSSMFKPASEHLKQFKGLAIKGVHAALSLNIVVPQSNQLHIAALLIKLSRNCNTSKVQDFLSNHSGFVPTQLCIKGKAGWDDALDCYTKFHKWVIFAPVVSTSIRVEAEASAKHRIPISVIICPKCKTENAARAKQLQYTNLGLKVKCRMCLCKPPSKDWLCHCSIKWHTCQRHAPIAAQNKANGQNVRVSSKASKRLLQNATPGQLLDDDLRKESRLAKITKHDGDIVLVDSSPAGFAIKPNMIPRKLKERFPNAGVGV